MQDENNPFMGALEKVKAAERKAKELHQEANEKSRGTLISAKKEAEDIRLEGEKNALEIREKRISEGKRETEKEVNRILASAEKKAGEIRKRKASPKDISLLMDSFLELP